MIKIWKKIKDTIKNDPLKQCEVYKKEGCAHVDGLLCNYPYCPILKKYYLANIKTFKNIKYYE